MVDQTDNFELIVIGAGPGGLYAALASAAEGRKTALIESDNLGGVCLNVGCIPVKSMLHASSLYHDTRFDLAKFGIKTGSAKIDFKKLMSRVVGIIKDEQNEIKKLINNENLTFISGRASFTDKNSVKVGKKIYSGKKFLISTGAKPYIPPLKGIEKVKYKVSDDAIHLTKLPQSAIIIGGGYISMELSTFFHDLGVKVTVLEKSSSILGHLDSDVHDLLHKQYSEEGMKIYTDANIIEIKEKGNKKTVVYELNNKKYTASASELFIITGRVPNTYGLNLEVAGVNKGEKGNIAVNEKLQTSNPDIFAIGDVNGRSFFANIAKKEAHLVLKNIFNNESNSFDPLLVPWATGTRPKLAHVGLSENIAKEKNIPYKASKVDINRAAGASAFGHTTGFAKIIYDPESRKILGCTLLMPHAGEIIHEIVILMHMNATVDDLKSIVHIHPTLSEVFEFVH